MVRMEALTGAQRRYLRSRSHHLGAICYVGKQGVSDALIASVNMALEANELIKVKFNDCKKEKKALSAEIAERTGSHLVGILGNVATFYRQQSDEEKRKIELPVV